MLPHPPSRAFIPVSPMPGEDPRGPVRGGGRRAEKAEQRLRQGTEGLELESWPRRALGEHLRFSRKSRQGLSVPKEQSLHPETRSKTEKDTA